MADDVAEMDRRRGANQVELCRVHEVSGSGATGAFTSIYSHSVFSRPHSLYRFWHYPSSSRLRLSQFVILPPYRKQAHGSRLYQQVYAQALAEDGVSELTIEDPNEAFDRLRDSSDLRTLLQPSGIIAQMKEEPAGLHAPLDRSRSEQWRIKAKIAKRQWNRLIEVSGARVRLLAERIEVSDRSLHSFNR